MKWVAQKVELYFLNQTLQSLSPVLRDPGDSNEEVQHDLRRAQDHRGQVPGSLQVHRTQGELQLCWVEKEAARSVKEFICFWRTGQD